MKVSAILLMAGEGKRFSSSLPKQFHRLSGKKIYLYTLEIFLQSSIFDEVLLVCPSQWDKTVQSDLYQYKMATRVKIICGGATRQHSSYLGVKACRYDNIVIHDAVRPFVTEEILFNNIQALKKYDACDTCISSTDTIVYSQNSQAIDKIPQRSHYLRGQTPQSFKKSLILKAHEKALADGINDASDDCQLILRLGGYVHIVQGLETNIKITSSFDLYLAEHLLRLKKSSLYLKEKSSLKDKIYVVTGATGGIGTEICQALEKESAQVIKLSLSSKEYPVDLTSYKQSHQVFQILKERFGPFDGLINSVGFLTVKPLSLLTHKEIVSLIEKNFTTTTLSCKLCPLKPHAHIINIASSSYSRGRQNYAIYSAMKAAIVNFTQGLSLENPSLCINSIIPPRTLTKMRLNNFQDEDIQDLTPPYKIATKIVETLKTPHITGLTIEI